MKYVDNLINDNFNEKELLLNIFNCLTEIKEEIKKINNRW